MLTTLVLALSTLVASPQDPAPTDRAAAFVAALNSGDAKRIAQAIVDHFEMAPATVEAALPRAQGFVAMHERMGEFEVRKVEEKGAGNVSVLGVSKKSGEWTDFQFMVGARPPGKMKGIFLAQATAPVELPKGAIDDPATLAWLREHVKALEANEGFSGAVLVAKGGKTLFSAAAGMADREAGAANTIETRFNLGSGNKMFTAIAIARLEKEGKLRFGDTIERHLPDWPNPEVAKKVTIRDLLTHTSGIPEYWTADYAKARTSIKTAEGILPFFVSKPLEFEPGSRFSYSNSGFIVLGFIVEKASGRDYFDYVRETVYTPAGMTASDTYPHDGSVKNLAVAYTDEGADGNPERGAWKRRELTGRGSAAGGGYSTVGDVLLFDRALRGGKLLPAAQTEELLRGKVDMSPSGGERYAFGIIESTRNGARSVGHGGTAPGCFFEYRAYPDSDVVLVVFANHDSAASMDLFNRLRDIVERNATLRK